MMEKKKRRGRWWT